VTFVIHALGRSRTAWLSQFLTYGEWTCLHEQVIQLRQLADIKPMFSRPRTGYAETAASFGWPLLRHANPDIAQVVIERDPQDACAAMAASYAGAGIGCDLEMMRRIFERGHRVLKRISALPGVLTLSYGDLATEEGCRAVFEYCLPYQWDRAWWLQMREQHVEADLTAMVAYYWAHRDGVENFKALCKRELMRLARAGELQHAVH
jgi:hypothetical protein